MSDPSAGEMLAAVVADLVRTMDDRRSAALADEPDAVHRLRTTARRLRNVLAAYRKCFDAESASDLRLCLKEYGDLLGRARDLEVRADQCAEALAELGLESLHGPLVVPLLSAHSAAHQQLVAWHRSPQCAALDARLSAWTAAPPLTARTDQPASKVATKAVGKQVDRVLAAAHGLADPDHDEEVHHLRKAARRLRHAADAATAPTDVLGQWARTISAHGQAIQAVLGDHRDALLLAGGVRERSVGVADPAPYLLVVARAEQRAGHAIGGLAQAVLELNDDRRP